MTITNEGAFRTQAFLVWNRSHDRRYGIGVIARNQVEAKSIYATASGLPIYEVRCELAPSGTKCYNPRGY